jgi:hypothetical protein
LHRITFGQVVACNSIIIIFQLFNCFIFHVVYACQRSILGIHR